MNKHFSSYRNSFLISAIVYGHSVMAIADNQHELDYLNDTTFETQSIAAGRPLPPKLSPSVTSVMTSDDIKQIGARRLQDVLEYLPGVHVSQARSGNLVFGFRGIYSEQNSQILVLINGIPVRDVNFGGRQLVWTMPVKNISHIEVIRGPGSMLYGGDATTGVINILLKNGKELMGGDMGAFVGNQETYEGWMEYGKKQDDWEVALALQGGATQGNHGHIARDAQTVIDGLFHTHASEAPGYSHNSRNDIDARLDIAYQDRVRLRAGYQRFNRVHTGEGIALALDNRGYTDVELYNADVTFKHPLTPHLNNTTVANFLGSDSAVNAFALPPGTMGGLLPQGAQTVTSGFMGSVGLKTDFTYTGLKKHHITLGTGFYHYWNADINTQANYRLTPFIQQTNLVDISQYGRDPLRISQNRTNYFALLQDEWTIAPDFYLTTGLRYDYYTDVTDWISPRVSFVWDVNAHLTTKLLYSRAFRPPSFFEKNQALIPGSTIKSENIHTVEFQIEKKWSPYVKSSHNVYWYEFNNLITAGYSNTATPVGFVNSEKITGVGFETDLRYRLTAHLHLTANYSYHGLSNTASTGLLPTHMIKSLINWDVTNNWRVGLQFNWIGPRKRPSTDTRGNLDDYLIAGVTLSTQLARSLDLTFRVNNLFGSAAYEPSLNPLLLPGDVPVSGRTLLGQLTWKF